MSTKKLFVSPLIDNVSIAELPSIVPKTVLLSLPLAPVIDTVAPVADDVSPMSISRSLDEPTQTIDAVAVPQELLFPALSQLKSPYDCPNLRKRCRQIGPQALHCSYFYIKPGQIRGKRRRDRHICIPCSAARSKNDLAFTLG